jgi:hypothetical protein
MCRRFHHLLSNRLDAHAAIVAHTAANFAETLAFVLHRTHLHRVDNENRFEIRLASGTWSSGGTAYRSASQWIRYTPFTELARSFGSEFEPGRPA